MIASVRGVLRPEQPLIKAANSLITNVVITSILGFGFWIAAARLFPSTAVGRDTVLISAMLTLSAMCQLNLTTVMLRFLPVARTCPRRLVLVSYAVVTALSLLTATAFAIIAPAVSDRFGFLHGEPWIAPVFVAAVAVWGIFTLQDAILTALRRSIWVPIENAAFGVVKIALLPLLLLAGAGHAVFLAWAAAMALLIVPMNMLIFRSAIPNRQLGEARQSPVERFGRRGLIRFSLHDLGGTLLGHASSTMLPVVVVAFVGSADSAYFFMPFMIIAAFDLMFLNVAAALTVEGAATERRLAEFVRLTARRYAPLLFAGIAVAFAAAPLVLQLYGAAYAESGTVVLRLLACASAFRAVIAVYTAVCRVEGRGSRILAAQGATFALIMGLTVALAPAYGIEGVAAAWLLANATVAAGVAPRLVSLLRGRRESSQDPTEGAMPCATSA